MQIALLYFFFNSPNFYLTVVHTGRSQWRVPQNQPVIVALARFSPLDKLGPERSLFFPLVVNEPGNTASSTANLSLYILEPFSSYVLFLV